jgi:hypothetical protein
MERPRASKTAIADDKCTPSTVRRPQAANAAIRNGIEDQHRPRAVQSRRDRQQRGRRGHPD